MSPRLLLRLPHESLPGEEDILELKRVCRTVPWLAGGRGSGYDAWMGGLGGEWSLVGWGGGWSLVGWGGDKGWEGGWELYMRIETKITLLKFGASGLNSSSGLPFVYLCLFMHHFFD